MSQFIWDDRETKWINWRKGYCWSCFFFFSYILLGCLLTYSKDAMVFDGSLCMSFFFISFYWSFFFFCSCILTFTFRRGVFRWKKNNKFFFFFVITKNKRLFFFFCAISCKEYCIIDWKKYFVSLFFFFFRSFLPSSFGTNLILYLGFENCKWCILGRTTK